ncbi:MAG: TniQ family protein [Rhodococcus sp. (in: high G+C Gram-positive bacteria)]|uniref:TniQ family protein n=1 Tax=Rhodococcus sp. TaxID=1831 RepID=UPI003BAE3449
MTRTGKWPLHPPPRAGEALSSWLYRIAHLYALSIGELLEHDLSHRTVTARELDDDPPPALLDTIAARSGVPMDRLRPMSLAGWAPWLLDNPDPGRCSFPTYVHQLSILLPTDRRDPAVRAPASARWRPWVSANRITRACPDCVAPSGPCSIPLIGQLPLTLGCPAHRRRLESCAALPHLLVRWEADEPDLRTTTGPEAALDALTAQALDVGTVPLPRRAVHAGVWFRMLRTLLDELCTPFRAAGPGADDLRRIWTIVGRRPPRALTTTFEDLDWPAQADLLAAAAVAIDLLGAGTITARGTHGPLLCPWPATTVFGGRLTRRPSPPRSVHPVSGDETATLWARVHSSMEAAIAAARQDPAAAETLFALARNGCRTEAAVLRLRTAFAQHGIALPVPDTTPAQPENAQSPG